MADQRNNQSNQNASRGQQSSTRRDDEHSLQDNQGQPRRNDGSTGWDESEPERSNREPAATANDSGFGEDGLESDESSIDEVDDSGISDSDDEDMGGSSR